jgi:hypothetical protein
VAIFENQQSAITVLIKSQFRLCHGNQQIFFFDNRCSAVNYLRLSEGNPRIRNHARPVKQEVLITRGNIKSTVRNLPGTLN